MPRYVFSHIDFFDNDLTSCIIEADSRLDALKQGLALHEFEIEDSFFDELEPATEEAKIDYLKQEAFDSDSVVEAICID